MTRIAARASRRTASSSPAGFEPAISALTGPHVSRYTTPPFAVSPVLLALWRVLPELNEQNFSTVEKNRQGLWLVCDIVVWLCELLLLLKRFIAGNLS